MAERRLRWRRHGRRRRVALSLAAISCCSSPAVVAFSPSRPVVHRDVLRGQHVRHQHSTNSFDRTNTLTCPDATCARSTTAVAYEAIGGLPSGHQQRNGRRSITALNLSPVTAAPTVASCAAKIIGQGAATFLESWKTFCLIPVIAAFVGWFTNFLAVKMIFYPIQWRGIPIRRIEGEPLGLLGWQGIVPAKSAKMSDSMINVTLTELLSMEEVILRLDPERVADILLPEVPAMIRPVVEGVVPRNLRPIADNLLESKEGSVQYGIKKTVAKDFLMDLTRDVQRNVQNVLDVQGCVRDQFMEDRSLLGRLFQRTGGTELKFLVDSGLWFGGLLGLIQMIVALYWDNPWTLSLGGTLVGLATNWIALKLIFEPVEPKAYGPFVLQGLFIRRQVGVAKDFGEFFASKILTSQQLWDSILTDPNTAPVFAQLFQRNLKELAKKTTRGVVNIKDSAKLTAAVSKATAAFPQYLSNLHGYVDEALDIEETLRIKMMAMSPVRFERVLHPIFEEDELTLILSGGFLGFLAGLVQQGLASGALTLPMLPLPAFLAGCVLIAPVLSIRVRNLIAFDLMYVRRYFMRAANKARDLAKKGKKKVTRRPKIERE